MFLPLPQRYKVPLLIALTIAIGVIVFAPEVNMFTALFAVLGAIVGFIFLDAEYIAQAYLIDFHNEHSIKIREYFKNKRFLTLIRYFDQYEYQFGEMSLRSALFQVLLAIFGFYFITTNANAFAQCLSVSLFANLLYAQILEFASTKNISRWFWILEVNLSHEAQKLYIIVMSLVLVFHIYYL
jgi:hypothetical protein